MADEHRRVETTDGRKIRTVSWQCRYCDRITTWTQPTSLRAYKYRVCAWCAATQYADAHGLKVMTG